MNHYIFAALLLLFSINLYGQQQQQLPPVPPQPQYITKENIEDFVMRGDTIVMTVSEKREAAVTVDMFQKLTEYCYQMRTVYETRIADLKKQIEQAEAEKLAFIQQAGYFEKLRALTEKTKKK